MDEVRRPRDDELCGLIDDAGGTWRALTVFGAQLSEHDRRQDAVERVLSDGLASLAERWTLRHGESGSEEIVCIREASPSSVTVARDYYDQPGVPILTITTQQLADGEWQLIP